MLRVLCNNYVFIEKSEFNRSVTMLRPFCTGSRMTLTMGVDSPKRSNDIGTSVLTLYKS